MGDGTDDFIASYNRDLALLGCDARVRKPLGRWHEGSLEILDRTGDSLGILPHTVDPFEMAALKGVIDEAYRRGTRVGAGG